MKYRIKMECFDTDNQKPYWDVPAGDPEFQTKARAAMYMMGLVKEETEYLQNECSSKFKSFDYTIEKDSVVVNCHLLGDEYGSAGKTQVLTRYVIKEKR